MIGTVFSLLSHAPAVTDVVTGVLGVPRCLKHADIYKTNAGSFERDGLYWNEYGDLSKNVYRFKETARDRDYIYLLNLTPRMGRQDPMVLRIPACGGDVDWTYENPENWTKLFVVWPA